MSSCESDCQDTEKYQDQSLNNARINSPSEIMSTPSTRNMRNKSNFMKSLDKYESDLESDSQWKLLLTKSIKQAAHEQTPTKPEAGTQSLKKHIQKTAEIKNRLGCTYENMCPICLNKYDLVRGSLECLHQFCYGCISEWCKTSTICPCCRRSFDSILKLVGSSTKQCIRETERISVEKKEFVLNSQYDYYTCYQCGLGDNEHVLLICDECDFYCCHVYCDRDLRNQIPDGDWYCIYCREHPHSSHILLNDQNESIILPNEANEGTNFDTDEESTPEKQIAQRTRSREMNYNLRSHLSTLRSFRRAR